MVAARNKWADFVPDLLLVAAAPLLAYYLARQILSRLDPEAGAKAEAQQKALETSSRLQSIFSSSRDGNQDDDEDYHDDLADKLANLTLYEQTIASEVVRPSDIPVTFDDIGGLEDIIDELRESVIYPLTLPHLYASHSSLLTAPSGVLLYGPPGCGKTMLARALARESGACFINLHISTLTEKWYGDSNKLAAAVFSLARKLQPTIVFIDEIDAVLGTRRSGEHEASGQVKAEFMTHWDGLSSATVDGGSQRICILGATNRIQDIDPAILRRMPKKFPVALPNSRQRRQIFDLTLRGTKIDRSASRSGQPAFDIDTLVRMSAGLSGSGIKEACRDAAMVPVRELIRTSQAAGKNLRGIDTNHVRGLRTEDFFGRKSGIGAMAREPEDSNRGFVGDSKGDAESVGSGSTEEVDDWRDGEDVHEVKS
ncbi:AAA-domain-containing protein [Acrodontium crateriforme]|uniref:AAA-domain-containing protein n=1 Tax=Acrodontium crateriforme TaxID=150365 RepID=A0AAQ3M6E3_9PEZI|nr:AAA-domain-containing protein [Acrodontium crateriforme]